jgi:hypothetical protein
LTVTGTTTTVSSTNTVVADSLFELNNGASSNANDLGIVMERGSTGNNAIIAWDESADKFTMGTTTATGASTGDLTIAAGTLVADLEGDVTGDVTGNADTATTATTATNVVIADTSDTTCNVVLVETATGSSLGAKTDTGLTYNAGTGRLNAVTSLGGFTGPSILHIPANEGSNFTLAADDAGAFVRINNASANTVTVPPNSGVDFPIGTQIILCVLSTGETTITPGSGVSLYSQGNASANSGDLKIDGQYATVALVQTLANQWHVFGKLTS